MLLSISSVQVNESETTAYRQAIVIGSSIAGLTAARILTDHFDHVTVVERDQMPDGQEFRKGIPQSRHPHALLVRGQMVLEQLFPGLTAELVEQGAIPINMGTEFALQVMGEWVPAHDSELVSTSCSRPLLEGAIYRHLADNPKITFLPEREMLCLCTDESGRRVTGVELRYRNGSVRLEEIAADLVVDASGRDSNAPQWLEALGFAPPQQTTINAFPGYATRIYERPADFADTWKALYIIPAPPDNTRGGIIVPMEGNRWHVTLIGMGGDYPPTDKDGFLEFARSLPSPRVYEAIRDARPLTSPYGYRKAENRLRHYDQLPNYLEGFIVLGDAVYALNPIYGQGMTVAALGSLALDECLRQQRQQHGPADLTGLAANFQKKLVGVITGPWQLATGEDMRWPKTEGAQQPDPVTRLIQRYMGQVMWAMGRNARVADAFFHVQQMVDEPTRLLRPDMMVEVFKTSLSVRFSKS